MCSCPLGARGTTLISNWFVLIPSICLSPPYLLAALPYRERFTSSRLLEFLPSLHSIRLLSVSQLQPDEVAVRVVELLSACENDHICTFLATGCPGGKQAAFKCVTCSKGEHEVFVCKASVTSCAACSVVLVTVLSHGHVPRGTRVRVRRSVDMSLAALTHAIWLAEAAFDGFCDCGLQKALELADSSSDVKVCHRTRSSLTSVHRWNQQTPIRPRRA